MELEFRNVTLRDRDEILGALSEDVYAGHDYLPCFFDGWMQDGEHQMICAVDKATGIIMALDTDNYVPGTASTPCIAWNGCW
eukprot:m.146863 g.146863  ORF g.146863 m.146863 type:complete len:82 (-) comp14154_c0_seq4:998-1243(-)